MTARRNFLLVGSGAAVGAVFTPVPWKLLDDASIWTQNWSWIPRPLRGEIKARHTVCTLCPAACGMKARCVGDQPVSVAGVPGHPVSAGRLCAMGLGAHQLPYHPARAAAPADIAQLQSRLSAKRRTVLLDLYPGRAASAVYSRVDGLTYSTIARTETATLRRLSGSGVESAGLHVEKARTILSFGAPVLERWGRVLASWSGPDRPRVVQIEPALSRSAALADVWLPIRPGTEGVVARCLLGMTTSEVAAEQCGVSIALIEAAKKELNDATLAVSAGFCCGDDEDAIAALNARSSALVRRSASPIAAPAATAFDSIPSRSIELLLIDHGPVAASPGWDVIGPKLAENAFVVSFSAYNAGDVQRANLVIPTPAWAEVLDDAVHSEDAAVPFYTIAPALLPRPSGVVDPVDLLGGEGAREAELKARVAALHKFGKGDVFGFADGAATPVKDFESADKLWEKFAEGACWTGEPPTQLTKPAMFEVKPAVVATTAPARPPELLPGAGVLPPLASKLNRESRLFTRSA